MSEVLGQKGFEGPSEQELEDYIKQSRKSLSRMKKGKTPLFFRPKKNRGKIIFGIMFIVVVSSGLILSSMSNFPSNGNDTDKDDTPPTYDEQSVIIILQNLDTILDEMIAPNHSTITPVMTDGSINTTRLISSEGLLDLIWYLHQFEIDSQWWNLGKELLFDKFPLWNESSIDTEDYTVQIKALRSYLVYSPEEIPLNAVNLEIFQNSCISLWEKIQIGVDNLTNTLSSSSNDSLRLASNHIHFLEFLTKASSFPDLFDLTVINNYGKNVLETLDQLTNITNGIPETFDANLAWISHIYQCKQQGELILALNQFDEALDVGISVTPLIDRLNKFIGNYLIKEDWSCSATFNFLNRVKSDEIRASDQSLIIRCNVLLENLQYSKYMGSALIELLEAPTVGFYSSSTDQTNQYLLDQILILLAIQDLIRLELKLSVITYPAATSWGLGVLLLVMLILVPLKKKLLKKKSNPK